MVVKKKINLKNPGTLFYGNILSSQFTILILQEFWEVEELWYKFLDIIGVVHERLPGSRNRVELPVSAVKSVDQETQVRL